MKRRSLRKTTKGYKWYLAGKPYGNKTFSTKTKARAYLRRT